LSDIGSAPMFVLRRANVSRISGDWQHEDYDVFDGDRDVGRIYLVDGFEGKETWFWGVSFRVTKRKSYGYALSFGDAKVAFRAEYETWQRVASSPTSVKEADREE
jgi:hypothetical protein